MGNWVQYVRRSSVLVVSTGICVACSTGPAPSGEGAAPESVGTRSDAIIGGQLDTTHQAVLMPHCGEKYQCICTGTLVKKDDALGVGWIATAAHCFEGALAENTRFYLQGDKPATFPDAKLPVQIEPSTVRYPILDIVRNPQYTGVTVLPAGNQLNDVAIVRVLGVGPESAVIPLSASPDGVDVGTAVTDVGYGSTGDYGKKEATDLVGKIGTRRKADVKVTGLTDNFIVLNANDPGGSFNSGDSGGPTLATIGGVEKVVGIHCSGNGLTLKNYSTRVTAHLDWINGELAKTPKIDTCGLCIQNETGGVRSCAAQYRTCLDDADCNVYAHCMEDCGKENGGQGPVQACRDKCGAEKPNANALYDAAVSCACQTCSTTCGNTCPAGSGSSNADASSPSGPSGGDNPGGTPPSSSGDAGGSPNLDSPSSSESGCSVVHGPGTSAFSTGFALFSTVAALVGRRRRARTSAR